MKAIFKISCTVILAICLISTSVNAESPFSSLGHGLLIESANARSAAMGYTSLAILDTLSLDQRTIAAWNGPPTARLGLGSNFIRTSVDDAYGNDLRDHGGLSGIAIAIPVGEEVFLGLAINPLTQVNYKWNITGSAADDWSSTIERHKGSGGMSQGIFGLSFPYKEKFRFGFGARGIFGETERSWQIEFPDLASWATIQRKNDRYKGFGVTASGHYQYSQSWSMGFSINSPITLKVQRQNEILRYDPLRGSTILQVDSTYEVSNKWKTPLEVAVGVGHVMNKHSVAGEIAWKGWGSVKEPAILADNFKDALRISLGWEFAPGYRAFDPRWKALIYRGGFYSQEHYALSKSGNQSKRLALTGGLGIPFNRARSRIDIAIELGMMGSESEDGVAEKFAIFTVGFNNSEKWFKGFREGS